MYGSHPSLGAPAPSFDERQRAGRPGRRGGRAEPGVVTYVRAGGRAGRHRDGARQAGAELDHRLHSRPPAVLRGGREVRVALAGAVHAFTADVVAADSAAAVVLDLEVPRGLVEAVQVHQVVHDVAPAEHVGDVRGHVVLRVLVQVDGEVEVEPGAAVRRAAGVLRPVVVAIGVGVDVVAAGDRELGTRDAVRVLPAERRRGAVGRVREEHSVAVVGALLRDSTR